MGDYTIYCFAGPRLLGAEWIGAEDHDRALASAARLDRGQQREVWNSHPFVGKIELDPACENVLLAKVAASTPANESDGACGSS